LTKKIDHLLHPSTNRCLRPTRRSSLEPRTFLDFSERSLGDARRGHRGKCESWRYMMVCTRQRISGVIVRDPQFPRFRTAAARALTLAQWPKTIMRQARKVLKRGTAKSYSCMVPCPHELDRLGVTLEAGRIEAIVSVAELNDTPCAIPYRQVVLRSQILERLHKTALHVPCLSCFDRCVD
jgi:hypothetical protein